MFCSGNDELGMDDVVSAGHSVDKPFGFNEASEVVPTGGFTPREIQPPMAKHFASGVEPHSFQNLPL